MTESPYPLLSLVPSVLPHAESQTLSPHDHIASGIQADVAGVLGESMVREIPLSQCHWLLLESDFIVDFRDYEFGKILALVYDRASKKVTRIRHVYSGSETIREVAIGIGKNLQGEDEPKLIGRFLTSATETETLTGTECIYSVRQRNTFTLAQLSEPEGIDVLVRRYFGHNERVIIQSQHILAYRIQTIQHQDMTEGIGEAAAKLTVYTRNFHGHYIRWKSGEPARTCLPVPSFFAEMDKGVLLVDVNYRRPSQLI